MRFKSSVSLVIHPPSNPNLILSVRRPDDDSEFPGLWGLPACSMGENESSESAAYRIGPEKLGIDVKVGSRIAEGTQIRSNYQLKMVLFESISPSELITLPNYLAGKTYYTNWRWVELSYFKDSAEKGSLCCELLINHSSTDCNLLDKPTLI